MERLTEISQKVLVYCREKFFSKDSRLNHLDEVFTSFCRTPLHIAVISGDIELATKILSKKPDLAFKQDSNGFTPLHLASVRKCLPMVRLLLKAEPGACIVQDEEGRTPLHLAVMKNRVEIIKLLLEQGLSEAIHVKNDKETILHLCVKSNSTIETLELLVNNILMFGQSPYPDAISVTSKDNDDKTILQVTAVMEKIELMQCLLESSNIKFEVNDVKEALKMLSPTERNDLKFGFSEYSKHGKKHRNKTNDWSWPKDRVNVLMVVATLIAGIAFQATLNPPGGFWQDDTKVDSGTDPITFAYYLDHMFTSGISGSLESYLQQYPEHTTPYNESSGGTQKNLTDFVEALMNSKDFSRTRKGIIFNDFNLTSVVSNYTKSNGSGFFFPYVNRYAGDPILAYTNPKVYAIYMNTNAVAFFSSFMVILMVLSGIVDDYRLLPLVVVMCISTFCIGISYWLVLYNISPKFYVKDPATFSFYGYLGLYCFYGITVYVRMFISRMNKLRNRHLIGINYFSALVKMNPSTAGKLIIFIFGYSAVVFIFKALF